jgi:hypothetical protein
LRKVQIFHTIESEAFAYCSNLETITIPSTVLSIGADAFATRGYRFCIIKGYTTPPTVVDPTAFPTNPVAECNPTAVSIMAAARK